MLSRAEKLDPLPRKFWDVGGTGIYYSLNGEDRVLYAQKRTNRARGIAVLLWCELRADYDNPNARVWLGESRVQPSVEEAASWGYSIEAAAEDDVVGNDAGDLGSEEDVMAKKTAKKVTKSTGAAAPKKAKRDPRLPKPGTIIEGGYKGVMHKAKVLVDGIEYKGKKYSSISKAGTAIMKGIACNGYRFFGLDGKKTAPKTAKKAAKRTVKKVSKPGVAKRTVKKVSA